MITEEQLQMIAEQLLPGFIPKDPNAKELTFNFTLPPASNFEVTFKRSGSEWVYLKGNPV